jgi:hypothetical protein
MKPFRKPLLFVHVTASVGLLGATSSSLLLALVADGDRDVYELISLQSAVFGIPLTFIALLTGIALGAATKWGTLRYWWTTLKLGLLVGVILNGMLNIGPTTAQLADGEGSSTRLILTAALSVTMLAVSVGLSVYKPGGRVRKRSASAGANATTRSTTPSRRISTASPREV